MKTLILSILLFISTICFGQSIKVIDTQNNPIENVLVIGNNFSSQTNEKGQLAYFPGNTSSQLAFIHPNYKRLILTKDQLKQCNYTVTLELRIRELEEVTIRPLKRIQSIADIPQKVIAITPEETLIQQPQTTADLLGETGEVFIQKSQMGGGSPMIRGFSANRIMLVVDGVRMNNAIYRSGNLHNVISLDATSLEQTEVILGPGSVIYGSDALGGVVHFYTLKPRLSTSQINAPITAMIRTSSANFEKTGHVNFNFAGKQWASVTSLTFSDFDDLRMGSREHNDYIRKHYVVTNNNEDEMVANPNQNKQISTGYSQLNAIQKVRFRPSEVADFEYAFHYSVTSDIPRYDRLLQYSGDVLKYAEWYYGPQKWMMHSLKAEFVPKTKLANHITVLAAFQDYTESRFDRKIHKSNRSGRTENVDIYSLNIDADKYFSRTQSLFYGIEGVYNLIHSNGIETNIQSAEEEEIAPRYPDGSIWWSMAAYAMYNQVINAETSLQAGVRYNITGMSGRFNNAFYNFPFDEFSDVNDAISVNFGMVFTPDENNRINLNAATGFRAPNMDDAAKVFDSEPGSVIVPNPDLDPEYASSFEAGYEWKNERLNFNATAFYTRLYNAMVRRDGQLNGQDSILYDGEMSKVQMLTNASWANIGGISSQLSWQATNSLKFKTAINWQIGIDSDGLPVRHVAPLFGNAHIEYQLKKFKIDGYLLFNGKVPFEKLSSDEQEKTYMYATDENGNPYSPAWYTLNIKASYKMNEKITLNAGIENLLDVRYRSYSSGIVAPGLNAIFSILVKL